MNKEEIIIELSRISTPTGITCCGDITLDDNTCDEILDFITNLEDENISLKQQLQQRDEVIEEAINLVKLYGKYDGQKLTRGWQMWTADFKRFLDVLTKYKGDNNE